MSTSRIVDGIVYGPAVTVVRNVDGTVERIQEDVQVQIALDNNDTVANRQARQARVRKQQLVAARKREATRQAARVGKQALEPKI